MDAERLKLVIVGDGGCGKTVLLFAYTNGKFDERYIPTVLDTYLAEVNIGDRTASLEIYDTAGQEDFVQIRTLVYPSTDVFIMCYSCVFPPSLANIKEFWYPETIATLPDIPFILVGNKLDLKEKQARSYLPKEKGDQLMGELGGKSHIQCSAQAEAQGKETGNVARVFKAAIKAGLEGQMERAAKLEGNSGGCCTLL